MNEHGLECWVHGDVKRADLEPERVRMVEASWDCTLEKDECQVRMDEREAQYWLGTEAGKGAKRCSHDHYEQFRLFSFNK